MVVVSCRNWQKGVKNWLPSAAKKRGKGKKEFLKMVTVFAEMRFSPWESALVLPSLDGRGSSRGGTVRRPPPHQHLGGKTNALGFTKRGAIREKVP